VTAQQFLEALTRLNLSQADVARQLGVTRGAVSRWASGARAVPGPVVELIRLWLAKQAS